MAEAPTATVCTHTHRCGKCAKDIQVAAQLRLNEVRRASASLPSNQRQCRQCGLIKSTDNFDVFMPLGERTFRCNDCEEQHRVEKNLLRKHPVVKLASGRYSCKEGCGTHVSHADTRCKTCYDRVRVKAAAPVRKISVPRETSPKVTYTCIDECGQRVSKPDSRCHVCKQQRQRHIAAKAEAKIRARRLEKSIASGISAGTVYIGDDAFALMYRCMGCNKGIIVAGKCYTCATGRPVSLANPPRVERAPELVAA